MRFVHRKLRAVLLVDDDEALLRAWKRKIALDSSSNVRIHQASDRKMALAVAEAVQPDLAIVDQHLHDGLGTDLLPDLRARAAHMLMILTSCDPTYEDARCAGSNAIAVLPKPISWAPYLCAIEAGDDIRLVPHEPATLSLSAFEASHISRVLRAHRNNITVAARVLGVDRSGLRRKLEKLRITIDRSKSESAIETSLRALESES